MTDANLNNIYNFLHVDDIGTSGQPTAEQIAAIQANGYEVVINLAVPGQEGALAGEAEIVAGHGMDYVSIPVIWQSPQPENLEQFFSALEQHADKKRYVHCIANMRVSAFMFLYRVTQQGMDIDDARADLNRIWSPNPVWDDFIADELLKRGYEPD